MFIIRAAFWLSIVILLIPGDPESGQDAPSVGAFEAILAARGAIADISGMCERRPDVCATGGSALEVFGAKARSGARMLYEQFDGEAAAGSSERGIELPGGTLTRDDAAAAWRAPQKAAGNV